jgi:hypothetical protein
MMCDVSRLREEAAVAEARAEEEKTLRERYVINV